MQNGYIERLNRLYREAVLDAYLFSDPYQVKQLTEEWTVEYSQRRLDEAPGNLTPDERSNYVTNKKIRYTKTVWEGACLHDKPYLCRNQFRGR